MKIRMIGLMLGVVALNIWGTASCEQPTIDCRSTRGSFSTRFEKITSTGSCPDIEWSIIGLQSYYDANAERTNTDVTKSSLSIRPEPLGALEGDVEHYIAVEEATKNDPTKYCVGAKDAYITHNTTVSGDFASVDPDADGICHVGQMDSAAHFSTNEIPASGDPMDPDNECAAPIAAIDSPTWEFRNVKVFVTTAGPGNRFEADLTYTEPDPMGGTCTQQYKICGLWPVVDCEELAEVTDPPDCHNATEEMPDPPPGKELCKCPVDEPGNCILPTGKPNNDLCDPKPDIELYGRPTGSSINEDFGAICHPTALQCVLPKCPI